MTDNLDAQVRFRGFATSALWVDAWDGRVQYEAAQHGMRKVGGGWLAADQEIGTCMDRAGRKDDSHIATSCNLVMMRPDSVGFCGIQDGILADLHVILHCSNSPVNAQSSVRPPTSADVMSSGKARDT